MAGSDRPKCLTLPAEINALTAPATSSIGRHLQIDAVLIEEIDAVGFQPLEAGVGHRLDVGRAGCWCRRGARQFRGRWPPETCMRRPPNISGVFRTWIFILWMDLTYG